MEYLHWVLYHIKDPAGRGLNLTQTPTIEVFNCGSATTEILTPSPTLTNIRTGFYQVSIRLDTDDPVSFYLTPHADDQTDVTDIVAVSEGIDLMISNLWSTLTDAAKTAIATAVWAFTGGRTITNTGKVFVLSPLTDENDIEIYPGYDYYTADGYGIPFSSTDWPDLTGATVKLITASMDEDNIVCTPGGEGETTQYVYVDIPASESAELTAQSEPYILEATLASGHKIPLERGNVKKLKDS